MIILFILLYIAINLYLFSRSEEKFNIWMCLLFIPYQMKGYKNFQVYLKEVKDFLHEIVNYEGYVLENHIRRFLFLHFKEQLQESRICEITIRDKKESVIVHLSGVVNKVNTTAMEVALSIETGRKVKVIFLWC